MSSNVSSDNRKSKNILFGRRQGRALSPLRLRLMDGVFPALQIREELLTENHALSPSDLHEEKLLNHWLEIGFGYGEYMANLAQNNPDIGYLGAEPFVNGMAAYLKQVEHQSHHNMRVLMDDGMIIARSLKPESLNGIYVLNPDPWHKTRHHKRRLINQENLDVFAKILKRGGQLIMTSDVPDLAEWMVVQASNHPSFEWEAAGRDHFYIPPENWIQTRYEQKGAKGTKKMVYLFFKRI
ncbi:MAG: tRNA (guanosine(46)-N7)-methyltransferase TrmB [Alphaproteobacteria bacterium]|nr:tRNA (guanosine(46)-N7)-methyltransferase TrmB [Alphaproteobacteria bacterium]